jgi:hypothetical protein
MTTPDTVGYASAARHYIAAGWSGVLPLSRGTKYPPPVGYTGRGGVWPDADTVERWAIDNPGGNIALRMPGYVIGIDVDHYGDKVGGDTLEALEQARGPLPPTWTSTSRGPGSSGIRFYRVPDGVELPGVLGPCIEAIQHHHRYAVVAPSTVDGRRYRWYAPDGTAAKRPPNVDELAELPAAWLEGWSTPREPITLERLGTTAPSTVDRSRAVQRALDDGLRYMRQAGSRHDMARDHCLALVRLLDAGHPGADEALEQLGWTFRLAISDRASARQAESEWQSMVDGAWDIVRSTPSTRPRWDDLDRTPPASTSPLGPAQPATTAHEAADGDPDRLHGWECVDLAEIVSGDYKRPAPGLLRRTT